MPFLAFKERLSATVRMQTERPWAGYVKWEHVATHPDMTAADLYIGLCCYFYVRALNLADARRARAVHTVAMRLVRRLERDEPDEMMARLDAIFPDALKDLAPLVSTEEVERAAPVGITVSFGVANNGMSPGTVYVKKGGWRQLFLPESVLLLIRDLTDRLAEADRLRLATAMRHIAEAYERRGNLHVGTSEASVADPALTAAGVWKRG